MLVHCFWLFEYKIVKFEFIFLCSFKIVKPARQPLLPNFVRSPQGRSLPAPLPFFGLACPCRSPLSLFFIQAQPSSWLSPPVASLSAISSHRASSG
jgi:hypothetical protein